VLGIGSNKTLDDGIVHGALPFLAASTP
jgi:hypothetical protein